MEAGKAAGSSAQRVPGGHSGQPGRGWGGCEGQGASGQEEKVEAGQGGGLGERDSGTGGRNEGVRVRSTEGCGQ